MVLGGLTKATLFVVWVLAVSTRFEGSEVSLEGIRELADLAVEARVHLLTFLPFISSLTDGQPDCTAQRFFSSALCRAQFFDLHGRIGLRREDELDSSVYLHNLSFTISASR